MLPTPQKYTAAPRIYRTGVPSTVTIVPESRTFLFPDDVTYTVMVSGIGDDEPCYHYPSAWERVDVVAKNGILRFDYTFDAEQEYMLRLRRGDEEIQKVAIYALNEDLYALRPLRGDLHSHTYRSDGTRDAAEQFGYYREQGYDFQALTDHNRYYPGLEIDEVYDGMKLGITHVQGEEVHTPGSTVHIVHVGGSSSVTDIYIHDRERYEREMVAYRERVPASIPEKQKERYAEAMWSCDRIHEAGGIAIFPHPYWRCGKNNSYNVCDSLTRAFLTSGMFDAFELVGGMKVEGINRAVALWQDLRAEGYNIPVVGSSDVHDLTVKDFPYHFTVCFATENTSDAIIAAIKNGMSVAVEMSGVEYEREYRAYGSMRLVTYAQFLFKHYFSDLQRACQGEGVAMRYYAMGLTNKETVEVAAKLGTDFSDRFFGRTPPVLPDAAMLAFEDKWRAVHEKSPISKGSVIDTDKFTRQV